MPIQESNKIDPPHYDGDACMRKIAEVTRGMDGAVAFCLGTAIKYLWRAGRKPREAAADDVRKAAWYLEWLHANVNMSDDDRGGSQAWHNRAQRVRGELEDIIGLAAPETWREKVQALRCD